MKGEQAVEIFKIVKAKGALPKKIEELAPLSFIGQAAVNFYRSKIRLMDQLKMTEEQRKATLKDGQDAGEMLLDIESRIGELAYKEERAKSKNVSRLGPDGRERKTVKPSGLPPKHERLNVLLSIKPKFAAAIFSGLKKFEFRRTIFKKERVKKIYVYASSPTCKVLGELEFSKILTLDPESLWDATKNASGITKPYFDRYFDGVKIAHALEISKTKLYKNPLELKEMFNISRPPQSFMYVDSPTVRLHL